MRTNPFDPVLLVEERGPVRIVTMNRPEALNAGSEELTDALVKVWSWLADDVNAGVVVLTGAGRAFSAGGDMARFQRIQEDLALRSQGIEEARMMFNNIIDFPLPLIAAVNGPAVGLGCTLATLCDLVYIAETAYLSDPHVSVGLTAGDGGAPMWPLTMPIVKAKELLFFGTRIGAAEAVDIGLANRVSPDGEVLAEAVAVAEKLAAMPPQALRSTKRAVNLHIRRDANAVLDYALAAEFQSYDTPEHKEVVRKFLDR